MLTKMKIGIPAWDVGNGNLGISDDYYNFVLKYGIPRIIGPDDDDFLDNDAFVLPGGPDMSPSLYNQVPNVKTGNPCLLRQAFYTDRLPEIVKAEKPVYGICLGMQMLNVFFGGTLCQHMYYHKQSLGRWSEGHKIYTQLRENGEINKLKAEEIPVNSHHHQAVTLNRLGDGIKPLAYAENTDSFLTGDNHIVEALIHKTLPIGGVQYHPEQFHFDFYKGESLSDVIMRGVLGIK